MLSLGVVLLSVSTLFASSNKPIYTIKDGESHRSGGSNHDKCYKSDSTHRGDGKTSVSHDNKCNDSSRSNSSRRK